MAASASAMNVDVSKLFDQAIEMYEASLKAGVKAQEEAAKFMTDAVDGFAGPVGLSSEAEAFFASALPTAQKNIEEAIKLMNKNAEACMELMRKAFDAGQAKGLGQMQVKTKELWEASLKASKTNTQALVDANARMLQGWYDLARKGTPAAASAK